MAEINKGDAIIAFGDGATPTEAFTEIGAVTTAAWTGFERKVIDTTDFDVANLARTFQGGLIDYGSFTFDVNFSLANATHDASTGLIKFLEGANKNYKITFPSAETMIFSGVFTSISGAIPLDDKVTASCSIKISGKPTFS